MVGELDKACNSGGDFSLRAQDTFKTCFREGTSLRSEPVVINK